MHVGYSRVLEKREAIVRDDKLKIRLVLSVSWFQPTISDEVQHA